MTYESEERLLQVEDELRAVLAENEKLKEQAEDVLIMGRLAETIAGTTTRRPCWRRSSSSSRS